MVTSHWGFQGLYSETTETSNGPFYKYVYMGFFKLLFVLCYFERRISLENDVMLDSSIGNGNMPETN